MSTNNDLYDNDIKALLVWDGGKDITIPEHMGVARVDQMLGTPAEQLTELAGRICYDSLGSEKSRGSKDYHGHIQEVGHLSVCEHFNFTISLDYVELDTLFSVLINRPGIFFTTVQPRVGAAITLNLRTILEWDSWTKQLAKSYGSSPTGAYVTSANYLGDVVRYWGNQLAPQIIKAPNADVLRSLTGSSRLVQPRDRSQMWVSLYMGGSRGFSHEQVRHGDFTAISQRSTRYCDESESRWITHPLITRYVNYAQSSLNHFDEDALADIRNQCNDSLATARVTYQKWVEILTAFLTGQGVSAANARKQSRGAARGYLGNALYTDMIFSANVTQWRRMLLARGNGAADAEIRIMYNRALPVLKQSRYGKEFSDLELRNAPDGIGFEIFQQE